MKVLDEIVSRAGLSEKFKGKMQVVLGGKDYEVVVKMRESFGEWAFHLTLSESERNATHAN